MFKTARISHLGGIEASYMISGPYKQYKPTLVLINSFATTAELYEPQFANNEITEKMNLIAIEPLGHGKTRLRAGARYESENQNFTYWDTAVMNLAVMDAIGVKKAFVLGTSQGGWIAVRMALIAPDRISGLLPLGTSMDYESERSRSLGCWDGIQLTTPLIEVATSATPTEDWEPTTESCNFSISSGFGKDCTQETRSKWTEIKKRTFQGNAGRKRLRECTVNLRDRDGLHGRLVNVKCPVLWLHGDEDVVYSVANAKEEIDMFGSEDKQLNVVKGGHHFLSYTNAAEVDAAILKFVGENSKGIGASGSAMREAVGMVDI